MTFVILSTKFIFCRIFSHQPKCLIIDKFSFKIFVDPCSLSSTYLSCQMTFHSFHFQHHDVWNSQAVFNVQHWIGSESDTILYAAKRLYGRRILARLKRTIRRIGGTVVMMRRWLNDCHDWFRGNKGTLCPHAFKFCWERRMRWGWRLLGDMWKMLNIKCEKYKDLNYNFLIFIFWVLILLSNFNPCAFLTRMQNRREDDTLPRFRESCPNNTKDR